METNSNPSAPQEELDKVTPFHPFYSFYAWSFLGHILPISVKKKNWDMVKASRSGPNFSHIFFADDIMLFAKANTKNCNAILDVLNNFCNLAR